MRMEFLEEPADQEKQRGYNWVSRDSDAGTVKVGALATHSVYEH